MKRQIVKFQTFALVPLNKRVFCIIDVDDAEIVGKYNWHVDNQGYARTSLKRENGKRPFLLMHRLINNTPKGYETDHINRNTLDNRKANLRTCTKSQNLANQISKTGTSKYKGVFFSTWHNKYRVKINKNGKRIQIGYFTNEIEAAKAYDKKAIELFGEFARTNFP